MSLHFTRKNRLLHFTFSGSENSFSTICRMFREGLISGVSRLGKAAAGILTNRIIAFYAITSALAVYSVQKQVMDIFSSLYLGTAETILVMSSVYYGEEDKFSLDKLQVFSMKTGILLAFLCSVVIFVFSEFLAGMYNSAKLIRIHS